MLITLFPNLSKIASICFTIPVSTASVERSFSEMKLIKTRIINSLTGGTLSQLMRFGIGAPEKLTDDDLNAIFLSMRYKTTQNTDFKQLYIYTSQLY